MEHFTLSTLFDKLYKLSQALEYYSATVKNYLETLPNGNSVGFYENWQILDQQFADCLTFIDSFKETSFFDIDYILSSDANRLTHPRASNLEQVKSHIEALEVILTKETNISGLPNLLSIPQRLNSLLSQFEIFFTGSEKVFASLNNQALVQFSINTSKPFSKTLKVIETDAQVICQLHFGAVYRKLTGTDLEKSDVGALLAIRHKIDLFLKGDETIEP